MATEHPVVLSEQPDLEMATSQSRHSNPSVLPISEDGVGTGGAGGMNGTAGAQLAVPTVAIDVRTGQSEPTEHPIFRSQSEIDNDGSAFRAQLDLTKSQSHHATPVVNSSPSQIFGQPITELVWNDLTIKANAHKKNESVLLDRISGKLTNGMTALMGPSGSGKSTLLNSLACRLDVATLQEGEIYLNGEIYSNAELKRISGYVMQDDLLNGYLTVFETLMYTAELRLPSHWTPQQKTDRVNEVIDEMGLQGCRDVLIGTHNLKGVSGGQKRRVCVGIELLTRPQLLFLDEPTSGLDSVTAYELVQTLSRLSMSDKGATIVCSIHQPQAKIFDLFTHLILLKAGKVMYQGRRSAVMDTFANAGFPCPPYTNPADHILDVITPKTGQSAEEEHLVDKAVLQAADANSMLMTSSRGKSKVFAKVISETEYARNRLGWWGQFEILLRRGFQELWRKRSILLTSLIQAIVMAVLIGTAFLNIGVSQTSVSRRQSVLFFCVINQGVFGALMVINSFPSERSMTLRERASGTYYVSAYFMAKVICECLNQIAVPSIFSFVVYWLVGLQNTAGHFFVFLAFMILCSLASTSLALMVSALCRTIDLSVTILPMALEISRLFGGYFLSPKQLPNYFSWLDALSYVKYTYVAISLNELSGLTYTCTAAQVAANSCVQYGHNTVDTLGLDYITIGGCAGVLVAYIVFTRFVAFLAVRFLKSY